MKTLFLSLLISAFASPTLASVVHQEFFGYDETADLDYIEERILETYLLATEDPSNPLNTSAVKSAEQNPGIVFIMPSTDNLLRIGYTFKDAERFGGNYLLGLSVAPEEMSNLFSTTMFVKVRYEIDLNKKILVITFEEIVGLGTWSE